MDPKRWASIQEHFDLAVALSHGERDAFLSQIGDEAVRSEVKSLLHSHESSANFMEEPPEHGSHQDPPRGTLSPGLRLGVWRIVRLIGHGGMGEVYEASRADAEFEQRAALKVIRQEATQHSDRFNAERRILARLDHPGIARLLDGGIATDGRPYAVMEYVEGESLLQHCASSCADLGARLHLFLQVCDAVAYAHRNLIIHRDIKPSNVLVDRDRRTRLLDFGIAKLLDADNTRPTDTPETARFLTPDYAAPEQLAAEPITTATDIFALGLLLFELLTGRRPWDSNEYPLARIVASVMDRPPPKASAAARRIAEPPIAPQLLEGDLDAIIDKCLRAEPEHRYATVNALMGDIERSRKGDPIAARSGVQLYVFARLLRRYRWAVAGVATLIVTLTVGIAMTLWQAHRAERAAARATATRDFLLDVFRASDPRVAGERAPGQITAKELLDLSVGRIEQEFRDDPQTQLELLGVASEIYGYWLDEERFQHLLQRRATIARERYGSTHPVVIESVTMNAWSSIYEQDYAQAQHLLAEADRLIRNGKHEGSLLRAEWWLAQAEAHKNDPSSARRQALDKAVELYQRLDRKHPSYAIALANSAAAHFAVEDFHAARARNEQAIEAFANAAHRRDGELALTYANYARSLQHLGELDAAERAYEFGTSLYRRLNGENHGSYWPMAADHARLVHMRGDCERASSMFKTLFAVIAPDWKITIDDVFAREYYAERIAAEGRVEEAIPLLEAAERTHIERPMRDLDLRRVRQTLGDAYDRAGRIEDAQRALAAAREERLRKDRPNSIAVLSIRERWARFLLDQGRPDEARTEFVEVVRLGVEIPTHPLALAHAGLARLALAKNDPEAALEESRNALRTIEHVKGLYDVRILPSIWRAHADALELNGDAQGAREYRARAADAEHRYNAPRSGEAED